MHVGTLAALVSVSILVGACGGSSSAPSQGGPNTAPTVDPVRYVTARANAARAVVLTGQDAEGDRLTFSIVGAPSSGTATVAGATLTYTPEADFLGMDYVEYQASDGRAASETGWLEVEVLPADSNAPPDAVGRILVTTPGTAVTVDLTAEDADGDAVSYGVAAPPAHGTLSGAGASRTYLPAPGFVGTDRFDFTADDGRGAPGQARVWITVSARPVLGTVTPAAREAAMAAMSAKTEAIGGLSAGESRLAELEAEARALPGVAMVGRSDTGLWGVFADGRSFAIVRAPEAVSGATGGLAPRPAPGGGASASAAARATRGEPAVRQVGRASARPRTRVGVPAGKTAMLFNGYPTVSAKYGWTDPTGTLQSMLQDAGYTAVSLDATVENLRTVKGQSVVHLRTHGGHSYRLAGNLDSEQAIFALWTSTEYSAEADLTYRDDLAAGRLVYMHGDDSRTSASSEAWHYGFTKDFVAANWKLNQDAYVHASACSAGSGADSAVAFRRALYTAGAARFGGWSYVTVVADFDSVAKFVFDRLLGANGVEPKESPPQRPMDADSVREDMVAKGIAKSTLPSGNVSDFVFKQKSGVTPLMLTDRLAPSIERVYMTDAWKNKLEIRGAFRGYGSAGLEVTVGGQRATVTSAEPDTIKADLPDGAAGDLLVTIEGRKSNRVRLSAWKGKLTYQVIGPGDLLVDFTVDVRLVGDVHKFRTKAGQAPTQAPGSISMDPDGSRAAKAASGTYSDGSHRQAWTGGGSLPVDPGSGGTTLAGVSGQLSGATPDQLWLSLSVIDDKAWHDLLERWDDETKTWKKDAEVDQFVTFPLAPAGLAAPAGTPIEVPSFFLKVPAGLGPDGTIRSGQIGPEPFDSAEGSYLGWTYSHLVKWGTMTPEPGTEIDEEMPR